MQIRKIVAAVGLSAGLTGAGAIAAVPSLVVGSTATAGLPGPCVRVELCPSEPTPMPTPLPITLPLKPSVPPPPAPAG